MRDFEDFEGTTLSRWGARALRCPELNRSRMSSARASLAP
jgi:hypothetical protein